MKNLHLLPTEKPSRLHTWINDKGLRAALYEEPQLENPNTAKNIYITSDEEIKDVRSHKGRWHLEKENILNKFPDYLTDLSECKLVIMTTDQDLINDGVQAIDDEFLEWFVKNPSCEEVEVIPLRKSSGYYDEKEVWHWDFLAYKIIISKEEQAKVEIDWSGFPKSTQEQVRYAEFKQETLEEAAEKYSENWEEITGLDYENVFPSEVNKLDFINGAKWQQEQNKNLYSEEDMKQFGLYLGNNLKELKNKTIDEIFEQFKKK